MHVIVTRPPREARSWVDALRAAGHDAVAWPLIEIAPVADPLPVRAGWGELAGFDAAMFVSANAVRQFFDCRPPDAAAWPAGPRAWATGPGTVRALIEEAVPAAAIDAPPDDAAQFDSEALWAIVGARTAPGARVLILRGGDGQGEPEGRDWLAARLAQAGAHVRQLAVYRRVAPRWTPAQRERAGRAAADGSIWLFSSSQAIAHLRALLPAQSWAQARAVATHPRIVQAAQEAGFGVVCLSRAGLDEVRASIESLQ